MTRAVDEWIGPRPETPPPPRVKARIVVAQHHICACGCGMELGRGGEIIEFDHTRALVNGGENRESNLQALRPACHARKTRADVEEKSRVARKKKKHLGFEYESRSRIPGHRGDIYKRKVGGRTVLRSEDG